MTLALISPRQNRQSQAQTSLFTKQKSIFCWSRCLLRPVGHQMCQLRVWKAEDLNQEFWASHAQPGFLSWESSARISYPEIKDFSASGLQPICLGSTLESEQHKASMMSLFFHWHSNDIISGYLCMSWKNAKHVEHILFFLVGYWPLLGK